MYDENVQLLRLARCQIEGVLESVCTPREKVIKELDFCGNELYD
jgi:hypothetical protein